MGLCALDNTFWPMGVSRPVAKEPWYSCPDKVLSVASPAYTYCSLFLVSKLILLFRFSVSHQLFPGLPHSSSFVLLVVYYVLIKNEGLGMRLACIGIFSHPCISEGSNHLRSKCQNLLSCSIPWSFPYACSIHVLNQNWVPKLPSTGKLLCFSVASSLLASKALLY